MTEALIRSALIERHMTQKELAEKLGCSEPLVSHLIKGTVKPTYRRAMDMERILGIPHQSLLQHTAPAA